MKKGILLSLLAVILLAVVVCAIWYINEEGKMRAGSKDSFIPYNSAVVVTINAGAELAPEIRQAFAADLKVVGPDNRYFTTTRAGEGTSLRCGSPGGRQERRGFPLCDG